MPATVPLERVWLATSPSPAKNVAVENSRLPGHSPKQIMQAKRKCAKQAIVCFTCILYTTCRTLRLMVAEFAGAALVVLWAWAKLEDGAKGSFRQ